MKSSKNLAARLFLSASLATVGIASLGGCEDMRMDYPGDIHGTSWHDAGTRTIGENKFEIESTILNGNTYYRVPWGPNTFYFTIDPSTGQIQNRSHKFTDLIVTQQPGAGWGD